MTKLEDIEQAVERLSVDDLARFRAWFDAWQEQQFDERIARDAERGALDWLADEAIEAHKKGLSKPLPG